MGLLSPGLLDRKNIVLIFSLHIEQLFWDVWLGNSREDQLMLLIFKGENVGKIGLQNHVFWCELSNSILKECMSYLNFIYFN